MAGNKVLDVAAYVLSRGPRSAHDLQKLVYFAQAWSLAWDGRPLFDDQIQAWPKGPVAPRLFREHRKQYMVHKVKGDPSALTDRDRINIDAVLDFYGTLGPVALVEMTHQDQPWLEARGDLPEGASSQRPITHQAMRRFYSAWQILGELGPKRPEAKVADPSLHEVMDEANRQISKWRSTLDWLAVR